MATISVWRTTLLISLVACCVTSLPVEEDEDSNAMEKRNYPAVSTLARSGRPCRIAGRTFAHGSLFSYPGFSQCIQYRCNNGGYSIVQGACERSGRCVPVGRMERDGCRSLQCVHELRGNTNFYTLRPSVQDMCEIEPGNCVKKLTRFEHNCQPYRCVPDQHGGYQFETLGDRKCLDDVTQACVPVGYTFTKRHGGRLYRNCTCTGNGGYTCP